jgi:membrane fusion protein (multidrug efflux system)
LTKPPGDRPPENGGTAEARDRQKDRPRHKPDAEPADSDDSATQESEDEEPGIWDKLRAHKIAVFVTMAILIIAVIASIIWYLNARHFETTDDAFIDGRPVAISPEVTGNIVSVPVTDNQIVQAGTLLAEIDPRDYAAAVQQAEAQIEQAQASIDSSLAQVESQKAQVKQAEKQVEEAQAALSFSQDQDARAQDLVRRGAGTVQNAQQTASDLISKQAALDAAVASHVSAERQVSVLLAQVKNNQAQLGQARAQKATAAANLTRTQLHATVDGRVTRLTAALGAAATPGQALMILVPLNLWVTANFKETQLADMRPGQPVDIEIDAYGQTFKGHVDSVQAGSGTAFSLLPAENATGNYVKVVQRIPVKLTFDAKPEVLIGPGMSVVPSVRVR